MKKTSAETRFPKKHRAARRWARKLRKAERATNRAFRRAISWIPPKMIKRLEAEGIEILEMMHMNEGGTA